MGPNKHAFRQCVGFWDGLPATHSSVVATKPRDFGVKANGTVLIDVGVDRLRRPSISPVKPEQEAVGVPVPSHD